jgi:hypothetical protein
MWHQSHALAAPLTVFIMLCGIALLLGVPPGRIAAALAVGLPVIGYTVFAIFTVIWAMKTGEIGAHQEASFMSKFFFWHGVAVVLCLVLAAAGSFIVLFGTVLGGPVGGLSH